MAQTGTGKKKKAPCLVEIFHLSVSAGTGSELQAAHFVASLS
jgi:hypothetical protein